MRTGSLGGRDWLARWWLDFLARLGFVRLGRGLGRGRRAAGTRASRAAAFDHDQAAFYVHAARIQKDEVATDFRGERRSSFDDSNVDETGTPPNFTDGYCDSYVTGYEELWGLSG